MPDQYSDHGPPGLLDALDPDWLFVGAKIEDQQLSERGTIVRPRGSLDLLDYALIEWDRNRAQQWVAHTELRVPRGRSESTYEWYRHAVEVQFADPKSYLPRYSLLEAEQSAWIRAFGSRELRQQLAEGMDYRIADSLVSEWLELHRSKLGSKQGEVSKHRIPGFPVPHRFVVVADAERPGHVKTAVCAEENVTLSWLIQRAEFYTERSADGQWRSALPVQPTAFLGIRSGGHWIKRHAEFVVRDPKNPERGEWINSVPIQGYASAADEDRAVVELEKLAMPSHDANLVRDRLALRAEFDKLTADVKARHSEEVSRLLRVAEAACQQPETVHERQNTRARGR